jgi:hypothetical protein
MSAALLEEAIASGQHPETALLHVVWYGHGAAIVLSDAGAS